MNFAAIFERVWEKKIRFFVTFFIVFALTYGLLFAIDFLPEPPASQDAGASSAALDASVGEDTSVAATALSSAIATAATETQLVADEAVAPASPVDVAEQISNKAFIPDSVYIKKLGKTVAVLNPEARSVEELDAALLDGVVRHPDSALLNQAGNVFILGHSSYLPSVMNKNFQAFNGIQKLEWGDEIEVTSGDMTFVYRVDKVYRAKASNLTVPIAGKKQKLTLATCNSFGTIDDRYIVEAYQIEVKNT